MGKTTTNYEFPKEYFKYINRFLKEVGLYPMWIKFLHTSPYRAKNGFTGRNTDWCPNATNAYKKKWRLVDVLGSTNFTDFLKDYYRIVFPNHVCTFELFEVWMMYWYPGILGEITGSPEDAMPLLRMDKEKKKTKLLYEKY